MRTIIWAIAGSLLMAATAPAQSVSLGSVVPVQRAVPFGTTPGRLLLVGVYLVFVDDQQPASSLVVPRGVMENLTAEGVTITVQVREPIRDQSGSSNRLIFRAARAADTSLVTAWYTRAGSQTSGGPSSTGASTAESDSYAAQHDHFRGSCKGRLIVTPAQLSFESIDEVGHSRRWEYSGIKEIELPHPYELEIKPFTGGNYKFKLDGSGMTPAAFRVLVDRVTSARSGK
jgi:hypothetical protein